MRKYQHLTRFRSSVAIAAIAVGLVSGASLPAAARVGVAIQPSWVGREHVPVHRGLNYAIQPGLTYVPSVPPDSCDLPSTGCESYLSN